ncbi:hypothetical protein KL86DYS1_10338 [uncultured Dysgonomonas sp.]|uniref:Uncharacterized protein n=1 Tax=uncultured Dysgonomonas sp. TaxID=206096 RepID=A0A212IW99_9BACT|nr:hypothetical protein KL86DYS1_10338 [uncultured Dysgonomonas sp.]
MIRMITVFTKNAYTYEKNTTFKYNYLISIINRRMIYNISFCLSIHRNYMLKVL